MLPLSPASSSNSSIKSLAGVVSGDGRGEAVLSVCPDGVIGLAGARPRGEVGAEHLLPALVRGLDPVGVLEEAPLVLISEPAEFSVGGEPQRPDGAAGSEVGPALRCAGFVFSWSSGPTRAETRFPGPTSRNHLGEEEEESLAPALLTKAYVARRSVGTQRAEAEAPPTWRKSLAVDARWYLRSSDLSLASRNSSEEGVAVRRRSSSRWPALAAGSEMGDRASYSSSSSEEVRSRSSRLWESPMAVASLQREGNPERK
jgi:hypothetical protein